jgi:hypothetical protein
VNSNVEGTLLEIESFFSPIDCETDLGAIYVDDGFGVTPERSPQEGGCFFVSTFFNNHKVYQHIWVSNYDPRLLVHWGYKKAKANERV